MGLISVISIISIMEMLGIIFWEPNSHKQGDTTTYGSYGRGPARNGQRAKAMESAFSRNTFTSAVAGKQAGGKLPKTS